MLIGNVSNGVVGADIDCVECKLDAHFGFSYVIALRVPMVGKENPHCSEPDTSEFCHFLHAANIKLEALEEVKFRQQINIATTMGVGYSCSLPIITMPPSVKGSCSLGMIVGGVYKEQDPNSGSGWLGFAVEGLASLLGPEAAAAANVASSLGEFTVSG